MSSACLIVKQPPFGVGPRLRPLTMDSRPQTNGSHNSSLWRPWLATSRDAHGGCQRSKLACPYSRPTVPGSLSSDGKPQAFQHPVRLFWPKSKSFDYLYRDGEILLRNFPIQATISFYEESDSEDEDDDDDEEGDWEEEGDEESKGCLKPQSHFTSYN